jgi:xylulokinase
MLLGLDLGTGSAKALLLAEDGSILGDGSSPYSVNAPYFGWAESSPDDWWNAIALAVRAAVGSNGAQVTALGLSGQMHGVVAADAEGRPVRPAILWADTRSSAQVEAYRGLGAGLRQLLANPLAPGMAGPILLWLRDHEPNAYEAARWALQPKDWLRFRLTGEAAAEPTDASATLLYDPQADDWAWPVVEHLGLREELLAPLVASDAVAGTLTEGAAAHLGLRASLPVAAGAGDTAAATLGSGLLDPGPVQLTVGTGGQIVALRAHPTPDPSGRTHLYRAAGPDRWYAMAAIQNAGLALEWARRLLGASWEEAYAEAFSVPPGAGGVRFLPYLSGERTPHFDFGARGAWVGLGLDHRRGHLLRAALEGVACALREALEALEAAGVRAPELRLAGGGTLEEPWRQLLADVLGRPLLLLSDPFAPSGRGAALLAGIATGEYRSATETLALAPKPSSETTPGEAGAAYDDVYAGYLELHPRLRG